LAPFLVVRGDPPLHVVLVRTGLPAPEGACLHPVPREMSMCLQLASRSALL
jgi:hypothetical protein